MNETEIRRALAEMRETDRRLTRDERARRREAGEARRRAVEAAGSYRLSRRDAMGNDVPERRCCA